MLHDVFAQLTSFVSGLEPWQQILALLPAGAIPFIESYLGSFLGTVVGIHPLIAVPAAVLGNLFATFAVTALAGGARDAVTRSRVPSAGPDGTGIGPADGPAAAQSAGSGRFRSKVASALDKYGVPGVCLLGPLVVASQITAPTLVALGATKVRIYLWMGVSIIAWGVLFGVFGGALTSALP